MEIPVKPNEARGINPFCLQLLNMDSRVRVYEFFGDYEEDKGFFVTKKHIYMPYVLPKVEHDIAHHVELKNPKRWLMADWGMPRFEKDTLPKSAFFAALSREIRTRAIQLHIEVFSSEEQKLRSTTWDQFNNPYWKDMTTKLCPFGRFRHFKDVCAWMEDLRDRTSRAWSQERVVHEWSVRLKHIQEWMES